MQGATLLPPPLAPLHQSALWGDQLVWADDASQLAPPLVAKQMGRVERATLLSPPLPPMLRPARMGGCLVREEGETALRQPPLEPVHVLKEAYQRVPVLEGVHLMVLATERVPGTAGVHVLALTNRRLTRAAEGINQLERRGAGGVRLTVQV